jgi:hypothetical protein
VGYFRILTAIPGFFISALLLLLLWNVVAPQVGLASIGYVTAMLINVTLWLAVAPLVAAGRFHFFGMFSLVPGFFLSSLFVMLLWGVVAPDLGLKNIEYPMAMLVTITSWIAVGPLAFTSMRFARWQWSWRGPRP